MECKACGKWFGSLLKADLCPTCERAYNRIFSGIEYDRLRELAQADREGRVVVKPAKTVFLIEWDAGPECNMECPNVNRDADPCDICEFGKRFVYERLCREEYIDQIGKTVFLTREEAEAALAAQKGAQDD